MLWAENIPVYSEKDKNGKLTEVKVVAGKIRNTNAPEPVTDSWAADTFNELGVYG
jgi:hypothetical protein